MKKEVPEFSGPTLKKITCNNFWMIFFLITLVRFEHLTVEKEKREREIAILKQKKLEREHE